jgi:DNA-binding GntR family transcriptional regulator
MTVKEQVHEMIADLNEAELRQVIEYVSFLKFQARVQAIPHVDSTQIGALYAAFAEEDRRLAEEDMAVYYSGLVKEDQS